MYKVIQGDNKKELDYWWDKMSDLEFDGLSVAPRPPNAEKIAIGIGYAMSKGEKNLHVLLGTGSSTIPLIVYAKKFFNLLTVDSSSFSSAGAIYRSYYLPYDHGQTIPFGKQFKGKLKELPCTCPVCQMATVDDLNSDGSLAGGLIALHNLYCVLSQHYFLEKLSDDKEQYIDYLRGQGHTMAVDAIEFLDDVDERGFEDAYNARFSHEDVDTWFV